MVYVVRHGENLTLGFDSHVGLSDLAGTVEKLTLKHFNASERTLDSFRLLSLIPAVFCIVSSNV